MEDSNFLWLLNWFANHCDGDWEHGSGIRIETLDNPAWSLTVNLENTELEFKTFNGIEKDVSENDWIFCFIKNKKFEGCGGIKNFPVILQIFRDWAST